MIKERLFVESQGLMIDAQLVTPDSGDADRAIVCVTGGTVKDCDETYGEFQEFMADEGGFASLTFNARGLGTSDGVLRTDWEYYDPEKSPANSMASRTQDTVDAFAALKKQLGIKKDGSIGVIGGSMGGDIVLHALDMITPGAVTLRAPSAYVNEVHEVEFGPAWGECIRSHGDQEAAIQSTNFARILACKLPLFLVFSAGEKVIPPHIQQAYIEAVNEQGGDVLLVGDETVPHTYLQFRGMIEDTPVIAAAREETYKRVTSFFDEHIKGATGNGRLSAVH